jgi:hypothetical protein
MSLMSLVLGFMCLVLSYINCRLVKMLVTVKERVVAIDVVI